MMFPATRLAWLFPLLLLGCLFLLNAPAFAEATEHTNNWAVLVCTSRFWFNYRHMANTLGMYRTVKRLGIPDSNIILMLADDVACNARNSFPGTVFANRDRKLDLYGENIEVDYRGYEVTVESFIRLLTGRTSPETPRSKRLLTDDRSNIFVYMTGHGGNEFLKFQDNEEISAFDIADAFEQMWEKKRYNRMLFMIDTCQANTMYSKFYSPNILATGSSALKENSYSHHSDPDIGVAVIDSYTHYLLEYMEGINKTSKATVGELFEKLVTADIHPLSHPGIRTDLFPESLDSVLLTDFFGGVAHVDVEDEASQTSTVRGVIGEDVDGASAKRNIATAREGFALGKIKEECKREKEAYQERKWRSWDTNRTGDGLVGALSEALRGWKLWALYSLPASLAGIGGWMLLAS